MSTFCYYDGIFEEKKVKITAINTEGKMLQWHRTLVKPRMGRVLPNWNDHGRALHFRFGHTMHEDSMSELIELKQTGSV